ncbi:sugar ABC transporter ATP-binding protein [Capsulimonas corticalis]|uniref:Sugar ABC transporter ATP-binding protein n=1 Tax=Capsulimonas corticalis TaxID=2219043 RepID=A0A402CQI2_9BACT|nr:ABC transporter ATP-binding protein [Capsulimonas corticalis]BDI32649.1 sugar ABC transporter ATP-binding protein [Capsulimonas corticalis]
MTSISPSGFDLPPDALALRGVTKRFGTFTALDGVDFTLRAGEIHALLGENGAGKSTLLKIVRGLMRPDGGEIACGGQGRSFLTLEDARAAGIGMVHQHFMLVSSMTVVENLALAEAGASASLPRLESAVRERAAAIAERLGWTIPWQNPIADLPVGTQQRVEIVKALLSDARILLFDEPTAVLAPTETLELFRVLRALRDEGRSLVFVSHKLSEVMTLCDRVTVLRRGKTVGTVGIDETNPDDLARRMVGDARSQDPESASILRDDRKSSQPNRTDSAVVSFEQVSTRPQPMETTLRDIQFSIAAGEILGVAGVDGNGQAELIQIFQGLRAWKSGDIVLSGQRLRKLGVQERREFGVAVIPPDRHREGLALGLSVEENLSMDAARQPQFRRGFWLRRRKLREFSKQLLDDFDIRADHLSTLAGSLSGGNQQKIVIARALVGQPRLLIAASPTRGLDVGATAYVHRKLRERAEQGGAILLVSTELDEIVALSHRIAVLYEGRIVGITPADTPRETLGLMMGGKQGASHG